MAHLIESLSGQCLKWGLQHDWLYSSDVPERRAQVAARTLTDTVDQLGDEVLNYQDDLSLIHEGTKPIRGLARFVFTQAVGTLVAPLGMVWNGFWYRREVEQNPENPDPRRVNAFWKAFQQDSLNFTQALLTWTVLGAPFSLATRMSTNPLGQLSYVVTEEEASGFANALALKGRFGLLSPDGSLLPYGPEDRETPDGGVALRLWRQTAEEIVKATVIAELLFPELPQTAYPPKASELARLLRQYPQCRDWVDHLRRLDREEKFWAFMRKASLELQLGAGPVPVSPSFPFSSEEYQTIREQLFAQLRKDHQGLLPLGRSWTSYIQAEGSRLNARIQSDVNTRFGRFREGVIKGDSCRELLGVSEDASDVEIRRAYLQLALVLHPDRCQEEEATLLFQVLSTALQEALTKPL